MMSQQQQHGTPLRCEDATTFETPLSKKRSHASVIHSPTFAEINASLEKRQRLTSPGSSWMMIRETSGNYTEEKITEDLDQSFLSRLISTANTFYLSPMSTEKEEFYLDGSEQADHDTADDQAVVNYFSGGHDDDDDDAMVTSALDTDSCCNIFSSSMPTPIPIPIPTPTERCSPLKDRFSYQSPHQIIPNTTSSSLSTTTSPPSFLNNNTMDDRESTQEKDATTGTTQYTHDVLNTTHSSAETDDYEPNLEQRPKKWSRWRGEEDSLLRQAVEIEGENWRKIAQHYFCGTRKHVQCKNRWRKALQPGLHRGRWTKEEDEMIIRCKNDGIDKWSDISFHIPGRIAEQIKERWLNAVNPALKKGSWTDDEITILENAQEKYGNRWSQIAKLLPGRSENSVKNRWYNSRTSAQRASRT